MKHVNTFENFLNENFKPFSDLEFAINQHEKDNHVYDLTKIAGIFNQLSPADQLKARKQYGDKYFPKLNEETADGRDTLGELDEMTLGQLERIGDYAKMIKDRMMKGEKLESWMYSQLTIALENLNSVHDAIDGNDGTVESWNENLKKA